MDGSTMFMNNMDSQTMLTNLYFNMAGALSAM